MVVEAGGAKALGQGWFAGFLFENVLSKQTGHVDKTRRRFLQRPCHNDHHSQCMGFNIDTFKGVMGKK